MLDSGSHVEQVEIPNKSKYSKLGPGNTFEMTPELRSVFDGLLLSDANLCSRSRVSAALRMEIHERNSDWLRWLYDFFELHGFS